VGSRRNDQRICGNGSHGIRQRERYVVACVHGKISATEDDCRATCESSRGGIAAANLRHGQLAGHIVAAVEGGATKCGLDAGVCPVDVIARAAAVAAIALNDAEVWRGVLVDRK